MPGRFGPTSSLVREAPAEEATFLSLPYIEELLSLYQHSALSTSALSRSLPASASWTGGSVASAPVRRRLELERRLEEGYFPQESPDEAARANADAGRTLALLRYGLARALGFVDSADAGTKDEPASMPTSLADQLLGRQRQVFPHMDRAAGDKAWRANAQGYKEVSGDQLRQSAFLEWFEDLLGFILARDFSAVQARCILVDTMGLLESLEALPLDAAGEEATDDLVEKAATHFLQDAVTAQTCAVPTRVLETTVKMVPVTRQVPDPELIATLEQRLLKEGKLAKKQQAMIQAQIAAAPLVSRDGVEEQHVDVEREAMVGPYFTLSEVAVVLDYLTGSVLGHWRLLQYAMTATQPSTEAAGRSAGAVDGLDVRMEDVDVYCVPPLREFLPLEMHDTQAERDALSRQAEEGASRLFTEAVLVPMGLLAEQECAEREALRLAKEAADRENRASALTAAEFDRVQRAYALRLQQPHSLTDSSGDAGLLGETDATTTVPTDDGLAAAAGAQDASRSAAEAATSAALPSSSTRPQTAEGAAHARGKGRSVPTSRQGKGRAAAAEAAATLPPVLAGKPRVPYDSVGPLPPTQPFDLPDVERRVGAVSASVDGLLSDPKLAKKATRAKR